MYERRAIQNKDRLLIDNSYAWWTYPQKATDVRVDLLVNFVLVNLLSC